MRGGSQRTGANQRRGDKQRMGATQRRGDKQRLGEEPEAAGQLIINLSIYHAGAYRQALRGCSLAAAKGV